MSVFNFLFNLTFLFYFIIFFCRQLSKTKSVDEVFYLREVVCLFSKKGVRNPSTELRCLASAFVSFHLYLEIDSDAKLTVQMCLCSK